MAERKRRFLPLPSKKINDHRYIRIHPNTFEPYFGHHNRVVRDVLKFERQKTFAKYLSDITGIKETRAALLNKASQADFKITPARLWLYQLEYEMGPETLREALVQYIRFYMYIPAEKPKQWNGRRKKVTNEEEEDDDGEES